MHKANVTCIHTEENAHSTDWIMSIFVNELAQPMYNSTRSVHAAVLNKHERDYTISPIEYFCIVCI